ncbi:hypothetical protein Tco_0393504 [Tanacetum coccineum]
MDNPNITMEEYIRLQEEKALSRGETFNWQTTTYGKMKYCEDEDDCFTNFKSEFPAIVLDNTITLREALSWEPTVSPLNDDEIDFRISFDESDDEDYTDLAKTMICCPLSLSKTTTYFNTEPSHTAYYTSYRMFTDLVNFSYMAPLPAADQRHPWLRYQTEYRDEAGSGSEVEDGIFWRGTAGICESCLEAVVWDPRALSSRVYSGEELEEDDFAAVYLALGLITELEKAEARGEVVTRELPLIDLHKLGRLHIYTRYDDTWAWVAQGLERQQDAAAGALKADEGDQAAEEVAPGFPSEACQAERAMLATSEQYGDDRNLHCLPTFTGLVEKHDMIMAPKRRATTTTTTTTPITDAQLKTLIAQGVADVLAEHDATRHRNSEDSHDSGTGVRRQAPFAHECTYPDFMKCQPLNFKGTKGFVKLTQWFERMETVFRISNCTMENQIKFATCTLLGSALTWWNSHELALMCDRMFPEESDKIEKYVGGLPDMIHGSVMASKPKTMQDAIDYNRTDRQKGSALPPYFGPPGNVKQRIWET